MSGLLPPLVLQLRAHAAQVFTELGKVNASVTAMEAQTAAKTTLMQRSFTRTAAAGKILSIGVAVVGAAVAVEATKMAANFQAKMTLLQTAAGESQSNMKTVSDGILNLAGATGTSIDQLSEGMYTIEKAGIRGADGLLVLKAAAQGAKAENVDLSTATNALTSVMMSYHLKAKDAVKVQNELVAGSGMAKTTMQEYAGSLAAVIPVASAAGINFAQVGGAIATLTQHGTSAQEATQELANTIRSLQAPNAVASKMMQQLGINVVDLSSHLGSRGLTGTIDLITKAITAKMGPSGLVVADAFKKSQSATADARKELELMPASLQKLAKSYMDGTVTQSVWRKSLKTMDVGQRQLAQQFAATVNHSRGFNDMLKAGNPAAQTFAGTLNKVMGGATGMNTALMLGGENMAYFKKATDEVSAASKKGGSNISTWAKTQQNLTVQLSQAKEGIAAMEVKIGTALIPMISAVVKTGMQWATFLGKNREVLYTIIGVVGGVIGVLIAFYVAQKVAAAATAVMRVGMVAYNLVAGIFGVVTKASTAASYGQAGATYASVAAQKAYAIGAGISKVATLAATAATAVATGAQKGFQVMMWLTQGSVLKFLATQALAKTAMIAGAVATGVVTAAQWLWNAAMDANPIGIIILAIAALVAAIIWLVANWSSVTKFLTEAWKNVGSFFATVGDAISKWWTGFWNGIVSFGVSVLVGYVTWVHSILAAIVGFFQTVGSAIGSAWSNLWSGVGAIVRNAFNGVVSFVKGILNGIIDLINGAIGGINTMIGAINSIPGVHVPKLGTLPHFATGGVMPSTGFAVVGEHGSEVVKLPGGAQVFPHGSEPEQQSRQQSGGNQVVVNVTSNASPKRIASEVGWVLRSMG